MKEVYIKYDSSTDDWKECLKVGLEEHGVIYNDTMLSNMCNSLESTTIKFLTDAGYKPRKGLMYRRGFITRISKHGLTLSIKTNYIFWKYLEYFNDLTDYSKCFDISIDIDNLELATKDMIFIGVNTNNTQGIVNHPLHCEEYADITKKLEFVKSLVDKSDDTRIIKDMLDHIIDVVDYLVRSID